MKITQRVIGAAAGGRAGAAHGGMQQLKSIVFVCLTEVVLLPTKNKSVEVCTAIFLMLGYGKLPKMG